MSARIRTSPRKGLLLRPRPAVASLCSIAVTGVVALLLSCGEKEPTAPHHQLGVGGPKSGQKIFRFDTFGDERFWTDTLQMHQVIQNSVTPALALSVGLKVDASALPDGFLQGADLNSPATTVQLLALDAVVGLKGMVEQVGGTSTLVSVGITCALCHSTVDNSVAPGIGNRLDGWPNLDLKVGPIVALSPALTAAQKAVYNSWPAGTYDARFNVDGINGPVRIPPAYGLAGVPCETYTCEGPISYWNNYVAVTQMHGHGSFSDPRLGINIVQSPDMVTPKLPALLEYQLSLQKPPPPAGFFNAAAAQLGQQVFTGKGKCATCHTGSTFTDAPTLHDPSETGMDPLYASRGTTGKYRTTPLRALWQHPPYFHDGSAATLQAVVERYNTALKLRLTTQQKANLVEYLKSL
jgi:mono/diheme cytochrome c family protein